MAGVSDVSSMAQSLQASIDAAVKRIQDQAAQAGAQSAKPAGSVKSYEQDVNKSMLNASMFATNIGSLTKDTNRLNVFSTLASGDPSDFYKFSVPTAGDATLGSVGSVGTGTRVQLMNAQGTVIADSNKDSGDAYAAYQKLQDGKLSLDKGTYTLRVAREKGVASNTDQDYGLQLQMGNYTNDYDTIAKQPAKGDDPFANAPKLQSLASILNGTSSGSNTTDLLGLLTGNISTGNSSNPVLAILGGDSGGGVNMNNYGGAGSLLNFTL